MEKYIIDRIEGKIAVLENEDGSMKDVEAALIYGCREGCVVIFENGVYKIDEKQTAQRKKLISEKIKKLFGEKD